MSLQALKFTASMSYAAPVPCELGWDFEASLAKLKAERACAALLVRENDLDIIRRLDKLVIDRHQKSAKGLADLLLGHQKIPLINSTYKRTGRALAGVRRLLSHAVKRGDNNIYIIGTSEELFQEMWKDATAKIAGRADSQEAATSSLKEAFDEPADKDITSGRLLSLLPQEPVPDELLRSYIGEAIEVQLARRLILLATRHDRPVLILGDTGTGKEVVARAIHKHSKRSGGKFVAVNCGAIPRELLEAELFGIAKGIATGVRERMGLWEEAGEGTLFLDEVGDLPLDQQVKVLRVLQEKKIRRIGETEERAAPARIIAASNRDLFRMVCADQFREDLYYRLRRFLIPTPALREHPEDIPQLAQSFWKRITGDQSSCLPAEIIAGLQNYKWPGNVRELKAVLMNIFDMFGKDNLSTEHLDATLLMDGRETSVAKATTPAQEINLHRAECLRHLRRVDEVIRACKVALRPLLDERKSDKQTVKSVQASIRQHLSEIELLCLRPLLFYSEVTFSIVKRFKGKLAALYRLLQTDPKAAQTYWATEMVKEYSLILPAIYEGVERLMSNS
jgi:DNA-binding NtrC family response regulator